MLPMLPLFNLIDYLIQFAAKWQKRVSIPIIKPNPKSLLHTPKI